jgi:phosphatidate cytidylyltransferase
MANVAAAPRGRALALRFVSAAVMIPLALAAVWFGPPYVTLIVAAAGLGMAWEWGRVAAPGRFGIREAAVIVAVMAAIAGAAGRAYPAALAAALIGAAAAALAAPDERPWTALGTLWIAGGCVAFLWLGAEPEGGRNTLLWLLSVVWASDILAYAAGKALGGPKLAPRWSPNKTWSGFAGGLAAAAAVAGGVAAIGAIRLGVALPVSLGLGLATQFGDLAESLAKRHFRVKDASGLIPGHGGVLDRLDGLIAAAIAAALLILIVGDGTLEIG